MYYVHNSNTCTIHVIHDGTVHSSEKCVQQIFMTLKITTCKVN